MCFSYHAVTAVFARNVMKNQNFRFTSVQFASQPCKLDLKSFTLNLLPFRTRYTSILLYVSTLLSVINVYCKRHEFFLEVCEMTYLIKLFLNANNLIIICKHYFFDERNCLLEIQFYHLKYATRIYATQVTFLLTFENPMPRHDSKTVGSLTMTSSKFPS